MNKVAFFDRDGTINVNFGHVFKTEDLEFVEGIPEKIRDYNDQGITVIVVTNQAGIAKGYYTEEEMKAFHVHMNQRLQQEFGARIDAFYHCPHHPDFTGECQCRKPKSGLFLQANQDFEIDFHISVMYGDKDSDQKAAAAVGITRFVLVECEGNV